ncbi:ABC transporter ATP-binding protein [Oxyplasma meridianum]|uniref:ABC transporter ATP-binding protein n=1 Tax=Oxyplasma meridianum TaxID=3073602 RepID=A0AAX4NIS4_9ARCH
MKSDFAIYTKDLVKVYDGGKVAVDKLNLGINYNEIYGFLGKNGAGKSTTIKILTTLMNPTSGEAQVLGMDVRKKANAIRKRIGVVQQDESFDFTTVENNLKVYSMLWEVDGETAKTRINEMMDLFDLEEVRKKRAFEISGGQKKRLQVAREFLHDMDLVFLDEPTVGMDPEMRRRVLDYITHRARGGLTVLFTTQILEEADYICDRIGIMVNGSIRAEGTSSFLKEKFGKLKEIHVKLSGNSDKDLKRKVIDELSSIEGVEEARLDGDSVFVLGYEIPKKIAKIAMVFERHDLGIESMESSEPSLDDVFLKVVNS